MKRDEHRQLDSGSQARWLRYASAGSVALASAGASGEIVLLDSYTATVLPSWATSAPDSSFVEGVDLNRDLINDLLIRLGFSSSTQSAKMTFNDYGPRTDPNRIIGPLSRDDVVGVNLNFSDGASIRHSVSGSGYVWSGPTNNNGLSVGASQYFGVKLSGNYGWIQVELARQQESP